MYLSCEWHQSAPIYQSTSDHINCRQKLKTNISLNIYYIKILSREVKFRLEAVAQNLANKGQHQKLILNSKGWN